MWFLSLLACTADDGACDPKLDPGGLSATLAGADFASESVTWRLAGTAVQLNAPAGDGSSLSIVLQTTTDGATADTAPTPFTVDLGDGGGGWIVWYPTDGASFATGTPGGAGTFEVAAAEDTLSACFSGTLVGDDGEETIEGEVVANPAP